MNNLWTRAGAAFLVFHLLTTVLFASEQARSQAGEEKLQERLVLLREIADLYSALFGMGEASYSEVLASQQEYLQAQLELAKEPAKRIEILRVYVQVAGRLERGTVEKLVQAKEVGRQDLLKVQAARLKAEADLADEQARLEQTMQQIRRGQCVTDCVLPCRGRRRLIR